MVPLCLPGVARTVFLILHDRAVAEEVAQDAFVQLYRHWTTVQGYERPDLWVRRVAIRLAVRYVKRARMGQQRERLAVDVPAEHLPDPDVARAVATLSPMQRAAVVLYYIHSGCHGCVYTLGWSRKGDQLVLRLLDTTEVGDPVNLLIGRFVLEGKYTPR